MSEETSFTIVGHQLELSEGRKVWAGKGGDDSWYLQFISTEGAIRRLRLSQEAVDALVTLLTEPPEILRYIIQIDIGDGKPAMRWEKFEPQLVDAPSPQENADE